MTKTIGWAATGATDPLRRFEFERREPQSDDVVIVIDYCGVCHSDIHIARSEWPWTTYPVVPGHEIVGRVVSVGSEVTKFSVGDHVGVGTLVGSCGECDECRSGLEQCCANGCTWAYGSIDADGSRTQGGYSQTIVVREHFVLRMPTALDPASAAPLLCAGVTMYSPLRRYVGKDTRVGIAGLGGLGMLGLKLSSAMGAHVTALTTSASKRELATRAGAGEVIVVSDDEAMRKAERSMDLIISTIPRSHDLSPYLKLLAMNGVYVIVGAIESMTEPYDSDLLINKRASITGSGVGGIGETQELLEFCAQRGLVADIELIEPHGINDAYDVMVRERPPYRYVMDVRGVK